MLSRVLLWLLWAPDLALTSYLTLGKSYNSSELEVVTCKTEASGDVHSMTGSQ